MFCCCRSSTSEKKKMTSNKGLIYNPTVPVTTEIVGGFHNDRMLLISGTPNYNNQRFTINLQERGDSSSDIGLHFDVRFAYSGGHPVVVRNNRSGGNWGMEERDMPRFPFRENERFYIIIHAKWDRYVISVNNEAFVNFTLRGSPPQRFSFVNIEGDVNLTEKHTSFIVSPYDVYMSHVYNERASTNLARGN